MGLEVANEIKRQLLVEPQTFFCWGVPRGSFVGHDGQGEGNRGWLYFKVNGTKFKGYVKVILNVMDYYDIQFIKMVREKNEELSGLYGSTKFDLIPEMVKEYKGIGEDNLIDVIDDIVERSGVDG